MSVFSAEDVAEVAAVGNIAHNAIYMAKQPRDLALPNGGDIVKLRDFIKTKYNDKKWFENGASNGGANRVSSTVEQHGHSDLWGKKQSSTSRPAIMVIIYPRRFRGFFLEAPHFVTSLKHLSSDIRYASTDTAS